MPMTRVDTHQLNRLSWMVQILESGTSYSQSDRCRTLFAIRNGLQLYFVWVRAVVRLVGSGAESIPSRYAHLPRVT